MNPGEPRIGITANDPGTRSARRYAAAVEAAGGVVYWITPADLRAAGERAALRRIDALLLSGGRDIDPQMYSESITPGLDVDVDTNRYEVEIPLGRAVLEERMPVLGICGGMQVLNVASGGSLYQDVSLLGIDPAAHRIEGKDVFHDIRIVPGSRLAEIMKLGVHRVSRVRRVPRVSDSTDPTDSIDQEDFVIRVNSAHHQAVKQPGRGAVITAAAPDGVIEAIEFPSASFAIGVEWHPERMPDDESQRQLFSSLVSSARTAQPRSGA